MSPDNGNPICDNQYTTELMAGATVVASVSGLTTTDNLSVSNTVSFMTERSNPYRGQTLAIRLRMSGGSYFAQTLFDNVHLRAEPWNVSLFMFR